MGKIKLWKNSRAIKVYAILAISLITLFQGYWIYTVYQSKRGIFLKESENILKKAVLEYDTKTIQNQILNSADGTAEIDDATRNLLTALKNVSHSVKVTVEDEQFNDSASRQIMEKLAKKGVPSKTDKSREIYDAIKEELIATFGKIDFAVFYYNKNVLKQFPVKDVAFDAMTEQVRSEMDSKQYYEIHFVNINTIIFQEMVSSILLSLIYIITCTGAVILLVLNVDKSRKLMRQKENFTNNMTHEFKTPMSTIYAAIEALDTYNVLGDKEMTREYLAMMKADLNRLISMTDSILFNAKMNEGGLSLKFEKINLTSFLQGVVENLKHVLEKEKATITIVAADNSILINVDPEFFGNVFRNLIDNSIKYSKQNALITIKISREGTFAKILFSDEGIGIPEKYKSEVFKPYFRVQENDVYTVKGYGLGLNYIKQIVEIHSGKISLLGNDNIKGATFEILMPITNE